MINYRSLINPVLTSKSNQTAEQSQPYLYLTERHIQAMWLEQKYFKNLHTEDGRPIIVLSPGIWNAEAGPDFLKAHILIDGIEHKGDIELHLSEENWDHHHHNQDNRYDNVVLHVSFWKSNKTRSIQTSQGKEVQRSALQPHLTIPEARLLKIIDLDLYPYQHFVGSGSCSSKLFYSLPSQQTNDLLRSAAHWRLEQKLHYLEEKVGYYQDCLIAGMAMTLGYKHNSEAFLELFLRFKHLKTRDEHSLLAYALGVCGFFKDPYGNKWSHSTYYQTLKSTFYNFFHDEQNPFIILRLDKIRPANHPIRRLATMAKIAADQDLNTLLATMTNAWKNYWQKPEKNKWGLLRHTLIDLIPTYHDEYWNYHYAFEKVPQVKSITLLGNDLKKEILLNIYFPLLYADINLRKNNQELKAFQAFYASLPASKSRKASYLIHRFFGNTRKENSLSKADLQQGAFQIHRDFCIHYEASCIGCPFVAKYKESISQCC